MSMITLVELQRSQVQLEESERVETCTFAFWNDSWRVYCAHPGMFLSEQFETVSLNILSCCPSQAHRHEVTICNYEIAANPADHKVESIIPKTNFISWITQKDVRTSRRWREMVSMVSAWRVYKSKSYIQTFVLVQWLCSSESDYSKPGVESIQGVKMCGVVALLCVEINHRLTTKWMNCDWPDKPLFNIIHHFSNGIAALK